MRRLVRLFRTAVLLLEAPSCVLSSTETAGAQPGDGRPSATTVLLAIRPLWMLEKAIPQQALVITALLVTVTFVQSKSKASMPCRPAGNESSGSDCRMTKLLSIRMFLEIVYSRAWRQGADLALHGVFMNAIADVKVVVDVILGDREIACREINSVVAEMINLIVGEDELAGRKRGAVRDIADMRPGERNALGIRAGRRA